MNEGRFPVLPPLPPPEELSLPLVKTLSLLSGVGMRLNGEELPDQLTPTLLAETDVITYKRGTCMNRPV